MVSPSNMVTMRAIDASLVAEARRTMRDARAILAWSRSVVNIACLAQGDDTPTSPETATVDGLIKESGETRPAVKVDGHDEDPQRPSHTAS